MKSPEKRLLLSHRATQRALFPKICATTDIQYCTKILGRCEKMLSEI